MYHHLTRRHISALLSVVVRDRLALYDTTPVRPRDLARMHAETVQMEAR